MAKGSVLQARFTLARDRYKYRLICSVEGEVGVGKTHFGCTGPAPVLVQSIDHGTEGTIEKFRNGDVEKKEIYEEVYEWDAAGAIINDDGEVFDADELSAAQEKRIQESAIEVRDTWEKDLQYFVDNGGRTVVADTESRIWQCYRYAEFGGPNGDNPRDYDKLNGRFERIVNTCKRTSANLVLVRSMKDKWGMVPGKMKASFGKKGREVWGYEHLPGCVNEEFTFIQRTKEQEEEAGDGFGPIVIKVGKCRISPACQFSVMPRGTLAEVGMWLVPDSAEEDWLWA